MIDLSVACLVDNDIASRVRTASPPGIRGTYARSVFWALRQIYKKVTVVSASHGSCRTIEALKLASPDVVFNLAYSAHPLEAAFAGSLEVIGVPYTGSGPLGIALSRDKPRSRRLLQEAGLNVPRFVELPPNELRVINLSPPLIVKPALLASSAGIHADSLARTTAEVPKLAKRIWDRYGVSAVCEEFIVGREFRIGLVESVRAMRPAGITEWRFGSQSGWGFKTEAVRTHRTVRRAQNITVRMAQIPEKTSKELLAVSRVAMAALDVRGYATLDFRMNHAGHVTILEVNANPGLWSQSGVWSTPSFKDNIKTIVNAALRKRSEWQEY